MNITITLQSSTKQTTQLKIYDLLGREVYTAKLSSPHTELNIANWQRGIYFVNLNGIVKKLVKM